MTSASKMSAYSDGMKKKKTRSGCNNRIGVQAPEIDPTVTDPQYFDFWFRLVYNIRLKVRVEKHCIIINTNCSVGSNDP